jgi:hypothetical protein
LCALARVAIDPLDALVWFHTPTRCWPDHEGQLACEAGCDPECDPGTVEDRCDSQTIGGSCDGTCSSRLCLDGDSPIMCAGYCQGSCEGTCDGDCVGSCDGTCQDFSADGSCEGACEGTCTGLCQGRCEGECQGACAGDPNLPAEACDSGASCIGGCSGSYESPTCGSPLTGSPCSLDESCDGLCRALGHLRVECDPAAAWILPQPDLDPELQESLAGALPALLSVRDAAGAAVLDEVNRMVERLEADPGSALGFLSELEELRDTRDLLRQLQLSVASVLNTTGPAQADAGAIPDPTPVDCARQVANGTAPLIDDFEDGDNLLAPEERRNGAWYVTQDGSGGVISMNNPPLPVDGGAESSARAMHLSGSGFSDWGAGLSLELRDDGVPYAVSVYLGIKFYAKGTGSLHVSFGQANLARGTACGTCGEDAEDCSIFYGMDIPLSGDWTQFTVPWSMLTRDFAGGTVFGPDQLLGIQFEVPADAPFDFWIDSVQFY